MKETAVLIDAGFLRAKMPTKMRRQDRVAAIVDFAKRCVLSAEEELYRIFYYDCPPYAGSAGNFPHPLGKVGPVLDQSFITYWDAVLRELRRQEYFAVRCGEMSFDGWILKDKAIQEILGTNRPLAMNDFKPNLRQKGVDLRIGVDLTLLSKDRLVDRIVLVAGDSDLVPAMKLARREGVKIVLVSLGHPIKPLLREHADIYRTVAP